MKDLIHSARNRAPSWRSLATLYSFGVLVGLAFAINFGIRGHDASASNLRPAELLVEQITVSSSNEPTEGEEMTTRKAKRPYGFKADPLNSEPFRGITPIVFERKMQPSYPGPAAAEFMAAGLGHLFDGRSLR